MIGRMKQRLLSLLLALAALSATPSPALAQDEDKKEHAWLNGYPDRYKVKLEEASNTANWLLFLVLAGAGIAVVFKNAKRSHLD
jgi:hypothetical protein